MPRYTNATLLQKINDLRIYCTPKLLELHPSKELYFYHYMCSSDSEFNDYKFFSDSEIEKISESQKLVFYGFNKENEQIQFLTPNFFEKLIRLPTRKVNSIFKGYIRKQLLLHVLEMSEGFFYVESCVK
jgi:hypothetical protein